MILESTIIKDILKNFVQLLVLVFVLKEVFHFSKSIKTNLSFTLNYWKQITFKKVIVIIPLSIVTYLVAYFLNQISFLSYGWTYLLYGTNKSILFSSFDLENINIYSILGMLILCFTLIVLIPHFAFYEESVFRKNVFNLKLRIKNSIIFGIVHCIMGISIGTGLALAIPGFFYSYIYYKSFKTSTFNSIELKKNEALNKAILYHTLMNTLIFIVIILCLLFLLFIKLPEVI